MEKNLRESEERYRRITEGLTDYLYTVRVQDGQVVETQHSEACDTVTGYTAKEFTADPDLRILLFGIIPYRFFAGRLIIFPLSK
jgi:hypothetical protein